MKTISPAMAAHLRGDTTTITTCWHITRQDRKEFFYTELDRDIVFEGNTYRSAAGFNKSAMKSTANFSIDEMEITGFLRDDGISDDEMRNGAFDFALVEVFLINYEDESMGRVRLRYGYFGEVKTTGSGAFLVELRGLVDLLGMKIGDTYLNECRQDVGDAKCGLIFTPPEHQKGKNYQTGDRVLFPQATTRERNRHYPELLTKDGGSWTNSSWWGPDLVMTPYVSDEANVVRFNGTTSTAIDLVDLGLSEADILSGDYKLRLTGRSFGYWEDSAGKAQLNFFEPVGPNPNWFILPAATRNTPLPYIVPGRRWRAFSLEAEIPSVARRVSVALLCDGAEIPGNNAAIAFDDLDIIVVRKDEEEPGFEQYGGIEYIAMNDGQTSVAGVALNPSVGAVTVDGTVSWQTSYPKYRFLSEVSATSLSATEVKVAGYPAGAQANWFDWGVLTFHTGQNAGRAMEVMFFDTPNSAFKLALPLPYQPQVGDVFSVSAGCNKTADECAAKFQNIVNFRGHPRVPGAGQYFRVAGVG
jgi:hypothetical protein